MDILNKKALLLKKIDNNKETQKVQNKIIIGKEYVPLLLEQERSVLNALISPKKHSKNIHNKIVGFLDKDREDYSYGIYLINEQQKRIKVIPVWINEYKGEDILYGENAKYWDIILKRYPFYLSIDSKWPTLVAFKTKLDAENFLRKNRDYDSIMGEIVHGYQVRDLYLSNGLEKLGDKVVFKGWD